MSSERQLVLSEIAETIQTGPFGSQLHQSDYSEMGTPVVMPKDLIGGSISEASIARISADHVARLSRHKMSSGDIVYSRRGDVGRCALVTPKEQGWLCGTGCLRVTVDSAKANPMYVFYYLQLPKTIAWVENHAVGATMLNLNTTILGSIPIRLPDKRTQDKVVSVISSYDELISTNQKQIALLEEAARRIYKEWFIDLRFPSREDTGITDGVPDGWAVNKAEVFFDITIGKTPPRAESRWFVTEGGIPWVSISDMGKSGTYVFDTNEQLTEDAILKHNVKVVQPGTILVSFKLTVGKVSIATVPMCTNEAIAHFRIPETALRDYAYWYLREFKYDTLGNTSSISQAVNSKIIKAMPFMMPDRKTIEAFASIISPIMSQIKMCQDKCRMAEEARDILLQKLLTKVPNQE